MDWIERRCLMEVTWDSLPNDIKNMARKYRDIAIKPDFRYLHPNFQDLQFKSYNRKDRDMKVGIVGLKQLIKWDKKKKQTVCSLVYGNQHRVQFEWDKNDKKEIGVRLELDIVLLIRRYGNKKEMELL